MRRTYPSTWVIVAWLGVLVLGSLASVALIALRTRYTGSPELTFLLWNLVLAWLPMCFGLVAFVSHRSKAPAGVTLAAAALWLLFLPNAPYLVTDLMHVGRTWADVPIWFDLLMVATFGATGLLIGYASIYLVQSMVTECFGRFAGWSAAVAAFGLSSAGVYLGRVLRFNSWDPFVQPHAFLDIAQRRLLHPASGNPNLYVLLGVMTICLAFGYVVFVASTSVASDLAERRPHRGH